MIKGAVSNFLFQSHDVLLKDISTNPQIERQRFSLAHLSSFLIFLVDYESKNEKTNAGLCIEIITVCSDVVCLGENEKI